MSRIRLSAALSVVVAIAASLLVLPSSQAADTAIAQRAYQEIQDCVSRPGSQLNVLYVIDESGSLTDTDPDAVRAEVLAQSLNQLGQISINRKVYSSVAMFAEGFRVERPWVEIDPARAREEAQWAANSVGSLTQGGATNWLAALEGAADSMQSSPDAATACKVVVWMTDGAISMPSASGTTEEDVEAITQICAASPEDGRTEDVAPIIARVRTSGINLIGVLLKSAGTSERQLDVMTYMRPIVEGQGIVEPKGFWQGAPDAFQYSCGQAPIPEDQAAGALIEADNPLDLAFKFAAISIRIAGGSEGPVKPGPPATFQIDPGVGYFYVLIEGSEWTLVGPEDSPEFNERTDTPDVTVTAAGDLRTVEVRGEAVRQGTWTVERARGQVQLFLYSGLELILQPQDRYLGESTTLDFSVERDSSPVGNLDDYRSATLAVTLSEPGGAPKDIRCTQSSGSASFACDYTPEQVGEVTVVGRLSLTTAGGIDLQPVPFEDRIRIQPTPDYPQVLEPDNETGLHQFTALVGRRGEAQGTLTLKGPAKGSGEVCFPSTDGITISIDPQPERIATYSFSGLPTACVPLTQDQTSTVSMSVSNPVSATGTVEGFMVVTLKSDQREQTATQQVAFTFTSDRKADPPIAVLAGLALLALALPIGLLYLQSTRAARLDLR